MRTNKLFESFLNGWDIASAVLADNYHQLIASYLYDQRYWDNDLENN